jgi:hypothetical protein
VHLGLEHGVDGEMLLHVCSQNHVNDELANGLTQLVGGLCVCVSARKCLCVCVCAGVCVCPGVSTRVCSCMCVHVCAICDEDVGLSAWVYTP